MKLNDKCRDTVLENLGIDKLKVDPQLRQC